MTAEAMRREVARLRAEVARRRAGRSENPLLRELREDPALILTRASLTPDPWQAALLRSGSKRILMLCSRQSGKSQTAAALALKAALLEAPALILILSRAQRQASELFKDKFLPLYNALGRPVPTVQESAASLTLANGSRVVSLPGKEETIRCYSGVRLLILDEAARVPDVLYRSVRPMLAVSGGCLVALSTPFGKRGWFYQSWTGKERWERVKVTARQCPRISEEFLREELEAMGPKWFGQEYDPLSFEDAEGQVFAGEDIEAALSDDVRPLL
jgi:hypothetical protein